jgi:hypothetical protein
MENLISKWKGKYAKLLEEYNYKHRGSENLEAQKLILNRMKDVLEFINDIQDISKPATGISHDNSVPDVIVTFHARVRFHPISIEGTFEGTIIGETHNFYIVIPDGNDKQSKYWAKNRCKIID